MSRANTPQPDAALPGILRLFLVGTVLLTLTCLAAEAFCRHTTTLNHLPYTHGTLAPTDDYADFAMFGQRFQHFHRTDFFSPRWGSAYLYPATVAIFYEAFYLLPPTYAARCFVVTLALLAVCLTFWFGHALTQGGLSSNAATVFAAATLLCSYPFYFELNRANMEIFIWLITGLGILFFLRDKPWHAATCIGIAGACKIYPFVFIALLIARRQYKQATYSLIVGALFILFSLWALTGNIHISSAGTAAGLDLFRWLYVLHRRFGEIGLDHSLFGFYKRFLANVPPPDQILHQLNIYLAVAAAIGCILYFARAIKLPVINQILFLTIACILLPPVSYDYTLLHLYTPFVLLVFLVLDYVRRDEVLPAGIRPAFICFILLLAPLNEVILHGERISGQLKCLTLLALAAISLVYRFTPAAEPA